MFLGLQCTTTFSYREMLFHITDADALVCNSATPLSSNINFLANSQQTETRITILLEMKIIYYTAVKSF